MYVCTYFLEVPKGGCVITLIPNNPISPQQVFIDNRIIAILTLPMQCTGSLQYRFKHGSSPASCPCSLFLRDCADCRLLVSCQQFRIRDSRNIHVFLHCSSQPVIENSTGIRFSNYQGTYDGFEEQFAKAGLRLFKNSWASIHDFTPLSDLENWSVSPEGVPKVNRLIPYRTSILYMRAYSICCMSTSMFRILCIYMYIQYTYSV